MKKLFLLIFLGLFLSGCGLTLPPSVNSNVANQNTNAPPSDPPPILNNKLNLSNQNLTKIPEYVFNQTNLQELDVSNNNLTGAIQAEIRKLRNLKVLNAGNNQMTGVPAEIGQLSQLEMLDLSNNQLTGLPYELGNLKNLKTFNISGNNYSELDLSIIQQGLPADVNIIK